MDQVVTTATPGPREYLQAFTMVSWRAVYTFPLHYLGLAIWLTLANKKLVTGQKQRLRM